MLSPRNELIDFVVPSCRNTDGPEPVKADWHQNFHSWGSRTIPGFVYSQDQFKLSDD